MLYSCCHALILKHLCTAVAHTLVKMDEDVQDGVKQVSRPQAGK